MMTASGPKLLEYNVRFGDPETEVLAPLYGAGLYDLLARTGCGSTGRRECDAQTARASRWSWRARDIPESPRTGDVIDGLGPDGQLATAMDNVIVFHAGTKRDDQGRFVTNGGRVLAVTGLGSTVEDARERAYDGAGLITFKGSVRRSDIALAASQGET